MIAYHILEEQIILTQSGKHFVVNREEKPLLYKEVKELIKENKSEEAIQLLDIQSVYENAGFIVKDGLVYIDEKPLPHLLSERILKFHEEKLPFEPLIQFWNNLKSNPSYRARNDLYSFLSHNGHPITEDGCFIAYKAVRSDFMDKHSGTMDNSIGKTVTMNREEVDDNPNNTCSSGLHFGAWDYVSSFCSGNGHILEIKVNPKNVVSIPVDYNNQKGRCCGFKVLSVVENPHKNDTLHNYDYENEDNLLYEYDYKCNHCESLFDADEMLPVLPDEFQDDIIGYCPECQNKIKE